MPSNRSADDSYSIHHASRSMDTYDMKGRTGADGSLGNMPADIADNIRIDNQTSNASKSTDANSIDPIAVPGNPDHKDKTHRAWITLLTGASYLPGVIVLAHSLRKQRSAYPLVVLVTPAVPVSTVRALELESARVLWTMGSQRSLIIRPVEPLLLPKQQQTKLIASRFADTWTKLRAFEQTEYETCVFLDADIAVYQNIDHLFDVPLLDQSWIAACHCCVCNLDHDSFAPDEWKVSNCAYTPLSHPSSLTAATPTPQESSPPHTHALLNGGMFVFHPSKELWSDMMHFFDHCPILKDFQFPDQDFLAEYFCHRWLPLSWRYNAIKTMENWHRNIWRDDHVAILHYIVDKPWQRRVASDGIGGHLGRDGKTHRWWWGLYEEWRGERNPGPDETLSVVEKDMAKPLDAETDKAQCLENAKRGFPKPISL